MLFLVGEEVSVTGKNACRITCSLDFGGPLGWRILRPARTQRAAASAARKTPRKCHFSSTRKSLARLASQSSDLSLKLRGRK